MLEIAYGRRRVSLAEEDVKRLRARALERAGTSSTLRDLGVMLAQGLTTGRPLLLRRSEARALHSLLAEDHAGGTLESLRELVVHAANEHPKI